MDHSVTDDFMGKKVLVAPLVVPSASHTLPGVPQGA